MFYPHYYTFFKEFEQRDSLTNPINFILSDGKEGLNEQNLIANTDRMTVHRMSDLRDLRKYVDIHKVIRMNKELEVGISKINKQEHYHTFEIPKASGGKRKITAPSKELKMLQQKLVFLLKQGWNLLEHNQAQAYVENKGIHTNADIHKNSNYFVKIDFSDFFPSLTEKALENILPLIGSLVFAKDENEKNTYKKEAKKTIENIKKVATYKGSLPQGAPSSPYLSNLLMVPFDYHMQKFAKENKVIYTRYADDITLSSFRKFEAKTWIEYIDTLVNIDPTRADTPELKINHDKTRESTKYGKNRVTGLKVNKDNNVTIGYKEKRRLKQELASIIIRVKKGKTVPNAEIDETLGYLAHLHNIEPEYGAYMEKQLIKKLNIPNRAIKDYVRT